LSAVVACSLTTDFDQFTKSGADAGAGPSAPTPEAGSSGSTDSGVEAAAPVCPPNVNLSTDPKNCGACGHDCLGGDCRRGVCQPVVLARGINSVNGVAVTSAGVYIGSAEGLLLLPPGANDTISIAPGNPQFMVATSTDVWYADIQQGAVRRLPIGSKDVVTIKDSVESIEGIALSPSFIFFSRDKQRLVQRMPFSTAPNLGATLEDLVTSYPSPNALDWRDGELFVATYDGNRVVAVGNDGKDWDKARVLVEGCDPYGLKLDGTYAYYTCGKGEFRRVPVAGGTSELILEDLDFPTGIDITPTAFYIGEATGGRVLMLAR
jgi:hypothetical protein